LAQKSEQSEDLRVRRTRQLLQKALIELTVEKGFGAVTVREITERAMVNRSTFYRHYLDKYELLNEYLKDVNALVYAYDGEAMTAGEAPAGLVNLLKHVQQFADFYRVMLGQNGDLAFTERFRQNFYKRFRDLLAVRGSEIDPKAQPLDLMLHYMSCACVGAILWWLEHNQPSTVEEFARWLSQRNWASVGLTMEFN